MKIIFSKAFQRSYRKLNLKTQQKADNVIHKFHKNPLDKTLKNHALTGKLKGKRAFSVTGNIRIIFEEHDDYVLVIMLDVGTHPQVYGS